MTVQSVFRVSKGNQWQRPCVVRVERPVICTEKKFKVRELAEKLTGTGLHGLEESTVASFRVNLAQGGRCVSPNLFYLLTDRKSSEQKKYQTKKADEISDHSKGVEQHMPFDCG